MLTTVQDLGRHGLQHLGVPVAGPMDWWSHEAANRLAGNRPGAALLEITLIGPELEFSRGATAVVTGAQFEFTVSGRPGVMNQAFAVGAGERVSLGRRLTGARAFLAVDGGFAVPEVLGSRATHVRAALGGHEGRALKRGDTLPIGEPGGPVVAAPISRPPHIPVPSPAVLRAIPGPDAVGGAFWDDVFTISPESDRMGYRLDGPALETAGTHLSAGVAMGTVQVTPSGTAVLLMADRATSGGYARAATVIRADLPIAGQLAPGDRVRFAPADAVQAGAALAAMRALLPDAHA
jgi:antagonist of KipI